jgi:hypothetical protein
LFGQQEDGGAAYMARYSVCEGVVSRSEEGKMFILDQDTARVLILNPSAAALWEHCAEGLDSARIPDILASSFDFSGDEPGLETATEDALSHLELLTKAGFLERVS